MTIDTLDLQDGPGSSGTFTNEGNLLLGRSAPSYPIDLLAGAPGIRRDGRPAGRRSSRRSIFILAQHVISQVALDGSFIQTDTGSTLSTSPLGRMPPTAST